MKKKEFDFPRTRFLKRPIGWEDLGYVNNNYIVENGESYITIEVCSMCKLRAGIYKKDGVVGHYCPNCKQKIKK